MQTSSREFAKKNGEMDSHLAIDETHFRRRSRATECSDGRPRPPASRDPCAGTSTKMQGNKALSGFAERRKTAVCGAHGSVPDDPRRRAQKACTRSTSVQLAAGRARRSGIASNDGRERKALLEALRPRRFANRSGTRRGGNYFLCRARFKSFRCLCFRIFLRRFLITLPTGSLPAPRSRAGLVSRSRLAAHTAPGRAND